MEGIEGAARENREGGVAYDDKEEEAGKVVLDGAERQA
jgi:hypothetical protein